LRARAGAALRLLALVVALVPIGARADSTADEAEARFRRGAELYKRRQFAEALLEFFASNRLAPNRNVVFNIARSYEALGSFAEAYQYYDAYRVAEPAEKERAAAAAKLAELAPRVALLTVTSEPAGATVYIDRKDLGGHGETPVTMALAPGSHRVLVEKTGFEPGSAEAVLARGVRVEKTLRLEAIVGGVRVESRPPAEVRIDRAEDDTGAPDFVATPISVSLAPGRHALELRAPGHRPLRRLLVVEPHATQTIQVELEALPEPAGSVAVSADVRGAAVSIDGKPFGPAPLIGEVTEGSHRVRVEAEGYEPWERAITVARDAKVFLEVELRELEPEVTAATRSAQRLGEAPASVSLVSAEELTLFARETLADALRPVRGLYESDDRNYRALGIRGFSRPGDYTNRVLVLRDGHVVNDDLVGSGFVGRDFAPDLDDVARIEVVRGPGSAFYGQGAFFGVVNVVSLAAGEGPALSAGSALLEGGGTRAHVRAATHVGDTALTLGVSAYGSSGQTLFFDEYQSAPSGGFARDDDAEDAERVSLRVQRGRFSLDAAYNRRAKDVPTASFDTIFDPAHDPRAHGVVENTLDERGTLEARYDSGALLLRLFGDYAAYHGAYPYAGDATRSDFALRDRGIGFWGGGEARVTVAGPEWNRLALGATAEVHDVRVGVDANGDGREDYTDHRAIPNAAVYAVDELALGARLRLTAGARLDRLGIGEDWVFSPRLAAVLSAYEGGKTKLVLGQAYRAPSDFEQYYSDGGVTEIPAAKLSAETIDTAELEHAHELGHGSYLLGAVFASRIANLIGLVPQGAELVYENSKDRVLAVGAELEVRKAWESGVWVQGALSVNHLDGGDALARANSPPLVASARAVWPVSRELALAAEVVVDAPRSDRVGGDTGAMVLTNLVASGRFAGRHVRWHVAVDNLLDQRWVVPVGDEYQQRTIAQDGRRLRAGLSLEY
jgi:outer membrane receptor protein involved in Fe transport